MSSKHGKNQEILRNQEFQDGSQCDPNLRPQSGQHGGSAESESLRTDRAMVEGASIPRLELSSVGGILSQLISQAEGQLADRREDLQRAQSGIQRLESYLSELKQLLESKTDSEN